MSKALVIKAADFSANKLTTITFGEPVPCTGITLDKSTLEILSIGGTATLIATATPADTTDALTWASSNDDVATISNGVITSIGVGTATITVTCGGYSATCVVTSRAFMDVDVAKVAGSYPDGGAAASGENGITSIYAGARYGGLYCSEGLLHLHGSAGANLYPYIFANNTTRIKITVKSGNINAIYRVLWYNHSKAASGYSAECEMIMKDSTGHNFTDGVYIVDIPTVEGYTIDSFVLGLRGVSGSTIVESDLDAIEVEFLPSA